MSLINCKECGKEISSKASTCPNCGAKNTNNTETASLGTEIICFLFPIIGIIVFATNISNKPKYAKGCLIASLLPIVIAIIIAIICAIQINNFNSRTFSTKVYDNDYLPYCKYGSCMNRVSSSYKKYCSNHSYLEY